MQASLVGLPDHIRRSLEAALTAKHHPRATIEPPRRSDRPLLEEAIALLGRLGTGTGSIEMRETLGEGGMGVVRVGRQVALGREVAVKSVRAEQRSREATLRLLREAWVTGALEHPNVVPVYDVRLDAKGEPQVVLKKIEGARWSDLIGDATTVATRFHAPDLLEWNLRVLMQVASAVHYAHSRGIIHRDLKPENVMIGPFGEVYVVDWGLALALALADDGTGRLPLASAANELAGTPYYMAPEMLGGVAGQLGVHTDVYLLGAVLCEVATGRPPRDGEDLGAILARVLEPVELPDAMPDELRRITLRAMDPDPAGRFESAEQLRLAITGFLAHRGSIQLADRAFERLAVLEDGRSPVSEDAEERRLRLYHLFGECRFGFQTALQAWPQNESARLGLKRALSRMVELELGEGDPRAAGILLAQIEAPDPTLVRRVDAARKAQEEAQAAQAALARSIDPSTGERTRTFVGGVMAATWTVSPLFGWWLETHRPEASIRYPQMVAWICFLLAALEGLRWWARDSLSLTLTNRNLVAVMRIGLVATVVFLLGTWAIGIPLAVARTLALVLWGSAAAFAAVAVDARQWFAVGSFVVAFGVAVWNPAWSYPAIAAANFSLWAATAAAFVHARRIAGNRPEAGNEARLRRWREFLEAERPGP